MKTPFSRRDFLRVSGLAVACVTVLTLTGPAEGAALQDAEPKAVQILLEASRSDDPLLRMHAIEAAKSMPDRALPMVQLGLQDDHPAVRFAALVTTGRLEFNSLAPQALRLADDAEQPDFVQAAALFAAGRCGEDVDLGRLAAMLWDDDLNTRSNVAMLFGWMDEPAVIPVLLDAAEAPMTRARPSQRELVRLQITEALLNLGYEDSLKALRGAAYSGNNEVRIMATLMLGRAGDGGMEDNLVTFLAKDPFELRLAAAESLARLGSLEGVPVMLEASERPRDLVRSQAAFALGQAAASAEAAARLTMLLDDPNNRVRIAAAAATLEAINR
ncbi:MAG: HEAT repeat domain-containing protein [Planctomycetota bacterium]